MGHCSISKVGRIWTREIRVGQLGDSAGGGMADPDLETGLSSKTGGPVGPSLRSELAGDTGGPMAQSRHLACSQWTLGSSCPDLIPVPTWDIQSTTASESLLGLWGWSRPCGVEVVLLVCLLPPQGLLPARCSLPPRQFSDPILLSALRMLSPTLYS